MKAKLEIEITKIHEDIDDFGDLSDLFRVYGNREDEDNKFITFDDFMLDQNSTADQQRIQIMNTNIKPMLMTFGDKARVYNYIIKMKARQKKNFKKLYDSLPAHVIVRHKIPLKIYYDTFIITGVWLKMNFQRQSFNDDLIQGNFQFFIINEKDTSDVEVLL